MSSDNPIGADNQQETRFADIDPGWVVGFTDGEGCFSVSLHRNELARPTRGWHIQPSFQVSQHEDHSAILEDLRRFFGCGYVRTKGPRSAVQVFVVHSTIQLEERVIPFFEENTLRVKRDDFEKFADIVRSIRSRGHHRPDEFERLVRLAYSMNAHGKQPGEPSRRSSWDPQRLHARHRSGKGGEDTVRSSWRHEDPGRNDLDAGPAGR